jgi:ABC-type Zn uptake system ZnuABC Zn-binding protein ZnuA
MRPLLFLLLLAPLAEARPLRVVATTTLVADIARQVAGSAAEVESLVPFDADPHAFQPAPRDMARLAAADMVLLNGLGLEAPFATLLSNVPTGRVVDASRTIRARRMADEDEEEGHVHHEGCRHGELDPHVWFDPMRVREWAQVIAEELATRDAANATDYRARATEVRRQLEALDTWAREGLAAIPPARRKLVTDHAAFGYFAERYGFEISGTVLPGFSTAGEPSARELAALMDTIRKSGAPAIFVERAARPGIARRLASDAGVRLVELPTCALTAPGGAASTYDRYFRQLVQAVITGLAP